MKNEKIIVRTVGSMILLATTRAAAATAFWLVNNAFLIVLGQTKDRFQVTIDD